MRRTVPAFLPFSVVPSARSYLNKSKFVFIKRFYDIYRNGRVLAKCLDGNNRPFFFWYLLFDLLGSTFKG